MAQIHMLKNEAVSSNRFASPPAEEKTHTLKTICVKLLYLVGGLLLFYLAFRILKTARPFILDLIINPNRSYDQMPVWLKWGVNLGSWFGRLAPDVEFNWDFHISGILRWIIALLWVFLKLLLTFAFDLIIIILMEVSALLPILLGLVMGIAGLRLISLVISGSSDRLLTYSKHDKEIHERGKEGEILAMAQLEELPDDYHVFGNLQFEYLDANGHPRPGEADFLVVGPTGLHLVEVKHWAGMIALGSNDKVICHTKTNGTSIEEKSPFYQAKSNSGKIGTQLRRAANIRTHINVNVLFTDSRLAVNMEIPSDCAMYKFDEHQFNQGLIDAICQDNGAKLSDGEVEQIVDTIFTKIWKPRFSSEALSYIKELD